MKNYYIAAFISEPNGGFDIVIPDVPRTFTCADTLEKGFEMARSVLDMMLRDLVEKNKEVPKPSDIETVKTKTAKHLQEIGYQPTGEILYQLIPAPELDVTPVKVTISLAKSVLNDVDKTARSLGYTRSGFLAKAAQEYIATSSNL